VDKKNSRVAWKITNNGWVKLDSMLEIKKGDIFKMYEENGDYVLINGEQFFIATADATVEEDGLYSVQYR
jgi:hypothetical protein